MGLKICYMDPGGMESYDKPIYEFLQKIKMPDTKIDMIYFDMEHPPHDLEYRTYEGLVATDIVRASRWAAEKNYDGLIIGCFYDPNLLDAREISAKTVVVGPCQASLEIVSNLANRFSVIVGREKWVEQMKTNIINYGYQHALASFRCLGLRVEDFHKDPEKTKRLMIEESKKAIEEDYAEAIILGCTIEYGFYQELQKEIGVPVIDSLVAPVKYCEFLAGIAKQFNWYPSRKWSCEPPPEKEIKEWKLFDGKSPVIVYDPDS